MAKSALYTGGGDAGKTSLVGGQRIAKDAARLEAYGTLDEFSSQLGVVLSQPDCPEEQRSNMLKVQNMLFDLGGYLATLPEPGKTAAAWGLRVTDIAEVEGWIDELDSQTPKVHAFVLPGGTPLSAFAQVARAVCRRAERRIVTLAQQEYVDPALMKYINRLSDYLFILARYFNHRAGVPDITWQKR